MEYLWPSVISAVVIIYITRHVMHKRRKRNLLSILPGPKILPIFGTMLHFNLPREEILNLFGKLRDEFGEIYVTWHGARPVVNLFHPKEIEIILGASNKHLKKGKAYDPLLPWLGTGLLTSSAQKWFTHRKLITPTFHFKILEGFLDVFNESSHRLVRALEKKVDGDFFNVCPYISLCALDIICETAMGTKINAQENASSPYVTSTLRISELTTYRQFKMWFLSDYVFHNFTQPGREFVSNLKILHNFSKSVIKERMTRRKTRTASSVDCDSVGVKRKTAFLDLLLDSAESAKVPLTDTDIREEVDTFMFEGHDTTTLALCWTLLLLGNNRDIQSAVRAEITRVFPNDKESLSIHDLGELKLLERVIKEALRLYPSVPIVTRILDGNIHIGGYEIPSETDIAMHIYNMHRNPAVYPDPLKFDPDRFLPEEVQSRHPYSYIPFSAGQRNCIGQKFAMYEEKVVLSWILRHFEVIARNTPEEVPTCVEIVGRPKDGEIFVKLVPVNRQ